jgi:DNA-binding winged helix-turn-helix (wHTH) protein
MHYVIGDLVVDPGRQSVCRLGVSVALPKLSYDLFMALIRAAPNLVSLDELMHRVWPGVVVSPETVSKRVTLLRDALGDDPRAPRYIAGLRGRGYRIVADVSEVADTAAYPSTQSGINSNRETLPRTSGSPRILPMQTSTSTVSAESEGLSGVHSSVFAISNFARLSSMLLLMLATAGIALSATGVWHIWSEARASRGDTDVTPNLYAGTWVGKLESCLPSITYSGPFTVSISNTDSGMLHLVYYGYGSDGSVTLTGSYDLRAVGRQAESVSLAGITYLLTDENLIVNYPKACQHGVLRRQDPQVQSSKLEKLQ